MQTIDVLRKDLDPRSTGSLSMPAAGLLVWMDVAVAGRVRPFKQAVYIMVFSTGAIVPLALLIARIRREELLRNNNPLAEWARASSWSMYCGHFTSHR